MVRTYRCEDGPPYPLGLLRQHSDFGITELDLVEPPLRLRAGQGPTVPVRHAIDANRVVEAPRPVDLLMGPPEGETTMSVSRRTLAQLFAWFLVAEDPQRRLDARPVSTLAHQASVVRHILGQPNLSSVLLADEVGLGKTVEAGLIIKELLEATPTLRVLYLAPAGLVRNVYDELKRLALPFRVWIPGGDARLTDPLVLASIHRAVHPAHYDAFTAQADWDLIVVDECHHLSDWGKGGGKPTQKYRLVDTLRSRLGPSARLLLMSGTPHQGHPDRFENLLKLLQRGNEPREAIAGRVIYRTKEDVRDWDGRPLFPKREVRPALVVDLGQEYKQWLERIHWTFELPRIDDDVGQAKRRALNWRASQALQWATSSIEAGLGFLARQAIRAGWSLGTEPLREVLAALRPYRNGSADEPVDTLFIRIAEELGRQVSEGDLDDIETVDDEEDALRWRPDTAALAAVLRNGLQLLATQRTAKWDLLRDQVLTNVGHEKVVLFAQPIETVAALANYLERLDGRRPALIIGGQTPEERSAQVSLFRDPSGPRFLVSSRAGGEGLNLQVARILVHVDVPWNPMELEQRVGRVHRFMSKRTIQVHTMVVKDSREVDMYDVARKKLHSVAQTMAPEKFEELFARVMSLVPPEEISEVLGREPLGPLSTRDEIALSMLVTEGYKRWENFHREFSVAELQVRAVAAGEARWCDVERFATTYAGAQAAEGFSALRFRFEGTEVVEESEGAAVLQIGDQAYACGDYGATPVIAPNGSRAQQLGLNVPVLAEVLRSLALPSTVTGPVHLRSPDGSFGHEFRGGQLGVLFFGKQVLAVEGGGYRELGLELQMFLIRQSGPPVEVTGGERAELLRALVSNSTLRRDPSASPDLVKAMSDAYEHLARSLRTPSSSTRRHVVYPLAALIVEN